MSQIKNEKTIIEFKDIHKRYRDVTALRGISFSIQKGDIFGFIGPNGAGKTTTLKILVGLISEYDGELRVNNQLISAQTTTCDIIGYMPQNVGFQEWRTVNHALMTFGLLSGMNKIDLEKRIPEVLEIVGLADARNRKIKHLSGGMQQKLKLAQALLHDPQILILDEPMSGLDPTSRWQMKNIIRQLAQKDITILFSSHILQEVEDITTTIGIISQGKIVKVGPPQELQDELKGGEAIEIVGQGLLLKLSELQTLASVERINIITEQPEKIVVYFKDGIEIDNGKLGLMSFFVRNKIPIRNFNYLKPSLEQVYLKYTMEESTNE